MQLIDEEKRRKIEKLDIKYHLSVSMTNGKKVCRLGILCLAIKVRSVACLLLIKPRVLRDYKGANVLVWAIGWVFKFFKRNSFFNHIILLLLSSLRLRSVISAGLVRY